MRLRRAFLPAILACIIPAASGAAPTTIPGKTIYGSTAWNASMNPITVTGDITIAAGATLTIGKGTEVRFRENSDDTHWGWDLTRSEIIVYGTLKINGTEAEPVTLTSTGTAAMGWFGIVFSDEYASPGATGTIDYCNIARSVYGINFTSCTPATAAPGLPHQRRRGRDVFRQHLRPRDHRLHGHQRSSDSSAWGSPRP